MGYSNPTSSIQQESYWPSGKSDDQLQEEMRFRLGDGPMQFGPVCQELSVRSQLLQASSNEKIEVYAKLTAKWEIEGHKRKFTDEQVMRVLRYTNYNFKKSYEVMKRTDPIYFDLTISDLDDTLRSKILFPVPGLRTKEKSRMFYMKPSRFVPKEMSTQDVIDNLIYVMNNLSIQDLDNKKGISFVANMNDWTMTNFTTDYCFKFMQGLQGRLFPAKVNLFLIVNPPSWFDKIWNIMKPMLSEKFRTKVHMINESQLQDFFEPGFESHLPDEFEIGRGNVDDMVNDYIAYQRCLEKAIGKVGAKRESKDRFETSSIRSDPRLDGASEHSTIDARSGHSKGSHRSFFSRRSKAQKEEVDDETSVLSESNRSSSGFLIR